MNRNKKKFLGIVTVLIIFCVFNCKKEVLADNKELPVNGDKKGDTKEIKIVNYAYILNPNGILLYKTPLDFKSKIADIPYGSKITLTNEAVSLDSELATKWSSASFKGQTGFIYSVEPYYGIDWIILNPIEAYNEKTTKPEPAFSIAQSPKTVLFELPSLDSKPIAEIDQFTLLPILTSGNTYDSFISNNIDLEMGGNERIWYEVSYGDKQGFVLNSVNYPTTRTMAEEQANNKILNQKGYFLLTSKKPTLYNMETKEPLANEYNINVAKENNFMDSSESRLITGEQVYLVNLASKINLKRKSKTKEADYPPYAAYISANDGMYFTEQKFSDYTVANTRFKGDMNAINIVRNEFEKRGIYLNYMDFKLQKISEGKFPQDTFLIASAYTEYLEPDVKAKPSLRSIILKQTDGVYEPVSGSIYTSIPIQYRDLDKDGIMEMIIKTPTRGGEETVIYGLKDGRYISMNSVLYTMGIYEVELKGDKIRGKKWVSAPDGKNEKVEIRHFKYENANFVEVKK